MKKVLFIIASVIIVLIAVLFTLNYISLKKPIVFKNLSGAMQPTIAPGEKIGIDRFAYINGEPKRGDIVVFKCPVDGTKRFIKRIIGLPGETLRITDGKILINGQEITSNFYYYNRGEYGQADKEVNIPQGSYYVLGDNSASSRDSRYWGFVPRKNIEGKVIMIKSLDGKMRSIE